MLTTYRTNQLEVNTGHIVSMSGKGVKQLRTLSHSSADLARATFEVPGVLSSWESVSLRESEKIIINGS